MDRIIVEPKNGDELKLLSDYLNKNGMHFITEEEFEFEKRMKARREFAELVKNSPKIDITDDEIDEIVEEVRTKRYEEKNRHRD